MINKFKITYNNFYRKQGCVTMCNYARTCKGSYICNLLNNFLIQILPMKGSFFVMHPKRQILECNFSSPCNLSFVIQLVQGCGNIFKLLVIKIKIFTCIAILLLVWHLCCTCVTLASQFPCSFLTDVALVLLFLHSSHTGFIRFAIMLLVSSTRVVKLTRSSPKPKKMFKNTNIGFEFTHITQMKMKVGVKKKFFQ